MLTLNKTQLAAANKAAEAQATARIEAFNKLPLTDNMSKYLLGKDFSEDFLATVTRKQFFARTTCINEAKNELLKIVSDFGATYIEKTDSLLVNDTHYFFGKVPEEFAPGKTVSDLKDVLNSEEFDTSLQKYLAQYWVKKDTFAKAVANGYAIAIPKGMTKDLAIEAARFNLTVERYREEMNQLKADNSFLQQYLRAKKQRELYLEGLVDDVEDTSRSADAEAKKKFFESLDEDSLVLYFLSRKTDTMLHVVNPFFDIEDSDAIYSLEEIQELIASIAEVGEYTNAAGVKKTTKPFSRIRWFFEFFEGGLIDKNVLGVITNTNEWVVNKFIEQLQAQ